MTPQLSFLLSVAYTEVLLNHYDQKVFTIKKSLFHASHYSLAHEYDKGKPMLRVRTTIKTTQDTENQATSKRKQSCSYMRIDSHRSHKRVELKNRLVRKRHLTLT